MPQPIPPAAAVRMSVVHKRGKSSPSIVAGADAIGSFGIAGIVAVDQRAGDWGLGTGDKAKPIVNWPFTTASP
jgi:hypothetical protein